MPKCLMALDEIDTRRRLFGKMELRHEGWESTFDAHNLAKHACTLEVGCHLWMLQLPPFVSMHVSTSTSDVSNSVLC